MPHYGQAGGSHHGHAGRTQVGARGERTVAAALNRRFASAADIWVFHDLNVPGMAANVDHALVRGDTLVLLDTKVWAGGWYWTWQGTTRRGLTRVDHADRRGLSAALDRYRNLVAGNVTVVGALLVLPGTSGRPPRLFGYRPPGPYPTFASMPRAFDWAVGQLGGPQPTDPALLRQVHGLTRTRQGR